MCACVIKLQTAQSALSAVGGGDTGTAHFALTGGATQGETALTKMAEGGPCWPRPQLEARLCMGSL